MNSSIKRALISLAVFTVIFALSDALISYKSYDVYVEAIRFLAAVIGAGCYYIGSNKY